MVNKGKSIISLSISKKQEESVNFFKKIPSTKAAKVIWYTEKISQKIHKTLKKKL